MIKKSVIIFCIVLGIRCSGNREPAFHTVPHTWVYCIAEHNDSIYFGTSSSGIFAFSPQYPEKIRSIAKCRAVPFRSLLFTKDSGLLASSYSYGVFMQKQDSMKLLRWAAYPAWSMRTDNGRFWLAGSRGVYFRQGDSIVLFKEISEAHDIAVFGDTVAVAHRNGVTLYKRNTGESLAQFADKMICWHIAKYDSLLVFGGIDKCVVEKIGICHSIRFGSDRNLLWSTVRDTAGYLYMGTQQGLFRAKPDDSVAVCVGYKGICVKSLLIDSKNRLWVGRFFRQGKKWWMLW